MRRLAFLLVLFLAQAAVAENWPGFRGPTRQGVSTETGLPTRWSATENVAWKTTIPGSGWSSPIVWNEHIFLTTAMDEGTSFRVLALDRRSGKILWNKEVFRQELTLKQPPNSYATPTPVTDGRRVYALSFNGKIAALSFDGQVEWTNTEVDYYSQHGLAVSPVLHEGLLIIPFDGSSRGEDKTVGWQKPWEEAFILALDGDTGKVRWRAKRGPSRIAHVTPNILGTGDDAQLVSGAGDVVQGFDLATGKRIWSVRSEGEGVVPSVVIGDDLVYTASGFGNPTIRAMRPGSRQDPDRAKVVWEQSRNVPSIPSFVLDGKHLFSISQDGIAMAMDATSGEIVWRERIGGKHSASPILADGRIWFLSEEGESAIINAKPPFAVVARNSIDEKCQASYAVSQGQIFIRSAGHLYCIGSKD